MKLRLFAQFAAVLVTVAPLCAQDMRLTDVLIDGEGWTVVSEGHKFTEGPAADAQGNVFFSDIPNERILKIDVDGNVTVFVEQSGRTNGMMFGPDGRLYGCRDGDQTIVAYDPDGTQTVLAEGVHSNDLVVTSDGRLFFTDPTTGQVWHLARNGEKQIVAKDLRPNGIILWPDEGTLVVTDGSEPCLWTFRADANGVLSFKERYYGPLRMAPNATRTGSDGMTIDRDGRLYVATLAGIQVFDPTGRLSGVMSKPQAAFTSNLTFGGPNFDTLYVTSSDKVFRRKTKVVGAPSFLRARKP